MFQNQAAAKISASKNLQKSNIREKTTAAYSRAFYKKWVL